MDQESDKNGRLTREAIWIRKTHRMNWDEGSYQLSHVRLKLLLSDERCYRCWMSDLMKTSNLRSKRMLILILNNQLAYGWPDIVWVVGLVVDIISKCLPLMQTRIPTCDRQTDRQTDRPQFTRYCLSCSMVDRQRSTRWSTLSTSVFHRRRLLRCNRSRSASGPAGHLSTSWRPVSVT